MREPKILKRHLDYAEAIIKREGLTFALAAGAGKEGDLREARQYLKGAICKALASEFALGLTATGSPSPMREKEEG
jgi:hypothetical protein